MNTCRDEILDVVALLVDDANDSFTIVEVVEEMRRRGSRYAESTIRTHIGSFMCSNAPDHHGTTYQDFERLDRGRYRILDGARTPNQPSTHSTSILPITEKSLITVPAGNSDVQRQAETIALQALAQQIGVELRPERVTFPSGAHVELDGVSHEPPVLVEVWAHQGALKPAQRNKVLSDALKMIYVRDVLRGNYRTILCLTDAIAAAPFIGRSWFAEALQHEGIDIEVVDIPDGLRADIKAAQARQFR